MKTIANKSAEIDEMAQDMTRTPQTSALPLVVTYGIAFILIFFVMGGYLPTPGTRVSSLAATSSSSDTIAGQLFQAITWAVAMYLMFPFRDQILDTITRMKAMVATPILAVLSVVWSQEPGTTIRRGVFLFLGTMFAFYLVRRFTVERLAEIIVITGVIAGVLGIFVSAALPEYGRDTFNGDAWQGIFRSKNGCAQIMLFFLSAAACFKFKTQGMELLRRSLYPISALLVLMSRAKTAWMLAPGLLLLVSFLNQLRRFEKRNAVFILVGTVATLTISTLAMPYIMPLILGMLGKDPEMSGRLPLWAAATASALKRPLLGYGYGAFWTGLQGESLNIFMTTHFEIYQAQNGILEVWLEIGLVGVALVAVTLFRAAKDAFICLNHGHSPETNWYICIIALTVVYNIDETFLASAHSLPWLLYIVACTGLGEKVRKIRWAKALASPSIVASIAAACPHPARHALAEF